MTNLQRTALPIKLAASSYLNESTHLSTTTPTASAHHVPNSSNSYNSYCSYPSSPSPPTIRHHLPHMINVLLLIFARGFFLGFFSKTATILRPESCPMISPLPSSLDQPEPVESSLLSQSCSSEALMLTSSLNSLGSLVRDPGGLWARGGYSMTVLLSLTILMGLVTGLMLVKRLWFDFFGVLCLNWCRLLCWSCSSGRTLSSFGYTP